MRKDELPTALSPYMKCPLCGGKGWVTKGEGACPRCTGFGTVKRERGED